MPPRIPLLIAIVTALSLISPAEAAIKDNDSSCDIALLPAATLLLPYFEVDLESPAGHGPTTIFTITNVTNLPQATRLTLWTDLAYPVISFNIYLTGYDVQSINLRDLIGGGYLARDDGTGSDVSPVGQLSGPDSRKDWDNPVLDESTCVDQVVLLPQTYIASIRQAFTEGSTRAIGNIRACDKIGSKHTNAVGYATIDVVGSCAFTLPKDAAYFANEIRWDNVLIGDYMQFSGKDRVAQAGPMVHIRAIPEGGMPAARKTNHPMYRVELPRTFYGRYQHPDHPRLDARQPLPSVFAARWIDGGPTRYETHFKVWREGRERSNDCTAFAQNRMTIREIVRFDEEENPETMAPEDHFTPRPRIPATARIDVRKGVEFPPNAVDAAAGWMYLNLGDRETESVVLQGWVVSTMSVPDLFTVDIPATALGNGCSAAVGISQASEPGNRPPIGPAPNIRP